MSIRIDSIKNNTYNTKQNNKVKVASIIGSTLGVGTALYSIKKRKPQALIQSADSFKSLLKFAKNLELSNKDVIQIASYSIAGGFIAGSSLDKKNTRAKLKEGITQLIGNYIIPSIFISSSMKLNKYMPKNSKIGKFLFNMASLILGVIAGNKLSEKINQKCFHEKSNHKLNWQDWSMQLDNTCLVTSMGNQGTKLAQFASGAIPFLHLFPGYLTGIKK